MLVESAPRYAPADDQPTHGEEPPDTAIALALEDRALETDLRPMISAAFTTDDGYSHYSGMANCIFRMAAVISLAIDNGDRYEFPRWIHARHFPNLSVAWRDSYRKDDYQRVVSERSLAYSPLSYVPNARYSGYFQSEKYFRHNLKEIQRLFKLSDRTVDACGVHVRRGDYLNVPHVLPVLPIEYYASAVDRAVRHWNVGRFVVYTDNATWARSHFLPRFRSYRMELSPQRGDIHDFVGLTECRWLITANSTFSVMAGILADHGRCISPRGWFNPNAGLDSRDIVPEGWTRV